MTAYLLNNKRWLKFSADVLLWSLATVPAFWLRLEGQLNEFNTVMWVTFAALIPAKLLFIGLFNLQKRSWQYSSIRDLFSLGTLVGSFTVLYFLVAWTIHSVYTIPLSVPLIEGMIALIALGGVRFLVRVYFKEHVNQKRRTGRLKRVIIAGAGDAGTMIAKEMQKHSEAGLKPVAFVDDAVSKWHQSFLGIPVAGRTGQLCQIAAKYRADELIIAMPSESGDVIRRIVELARSCDLPHKIIPSLSDLISGRVSINTLRNVDVEDLLRRKPVKLETDKIRAYVSGKRVMVTGAGGSIGSEIVRQISRFDPECIVLLGRGENSIHQIVREMRIHFSHIPIHIKIADVRDYTTLHQVFQETRPEVVFHAAAHKHVPLMEANPSQAIFNNVGGTRNLVNLSLNFDVKYFVNISTDKAVNPTSVMGASKRISEYIVQNGAELAGPDQNFVSVRFGNVLGSRGSVIPIFKDQIKAGGPVTVTHPEMIRYFMTIPEASQLVLQAGALHQNGAVFVLDMGDPVNIMDMAEDLIRLSGLEPGKDIKIEVTGIRDGEKLYEELLTAEEGTTMSQFEKIMVAKKSGLPENFSRKLDDLFVTAESGDPYAIKEMIYSLIPTYSGLKEEKV